MKKREISEADAQGETDTGQTQADSCNVCSGHDEQAHVADLHKGMDCIAGLRGRHTGQCGGFHDDIRMVRALHLCWPERQEQQQLEIITSVALAGNPGPGYGATAIVKVCNKGYQALLFCVLHAKMTTATSSTSS
jgi:hypothetical protein